MLLHSIAKRVARDAKQRRHLLPRIASGEIVLTVAIAEPDARGLWEPPRLAPSGRRLTGRKRLVPFAAAADLLLVGTAGPSVAPGARSVECVDAELVELGHLAHPARAHPVSVIVRGLADLAQPQAGQGEFVPIKELPPGEQLPAAPLLIAAYSVVWVALMVYLWSIWTRLARVERELAALSHKTGVRPSRP